MPLPYFDCHCHSNHSSDAKDPMEMLFQSAYDQGLQGITITDHYDYGYYPTDEDFIASMAGSVAEYRRIAASGRFDGKMKILLGMEMGEAIHNIEKAEEALALADFDFVLGSQHAVRGEVDFYFREFESMDMVKEFDKMYREMMELIGWGKIDVLSHLNYPIRYSMNRCGKTVAMEPFKEVLAELFHKVVQAGKGIEINTSGLRQNVGSPLPGLEDFQLSKACGGEIVTLGSDAHNAGDVGADFEAAATLLKEAGFTHAAYFEKHNPVFYAL